MASFEERKHEIASKYVDAARSQNLKLMREAMLEHQELVLEEEGDASDLVPILKSAGQRVMGRAVSRATIVELVDLVSDVREGMTGSQQLTLFLQALLSNAELGTTDNRELRETVEAVKSPPRRFSVSRHRYEAPERPNFGELDLDGKGFGDGAIRGIVIAVSGAALLGGLLYLLSLIA